MTPQLKTLLDSWNSDIRAAEAMAQYLTQIGLPADNIPSRLPVRTGCLALQAPKTLNRLRATLLAEEEDLIRQGVLHAGQRIASLPGGALLVLHHVLDKLPLLSEQIEDMLERACTFVPPETPAEGLPEIKTATDRVEGHRYQMVNLLVRLRKVDRLLIYDEMQANQRILLFPPSLVSVTMPIMEGVLLLYAENTDGAALSRVAFSEVSYV